jgi:hypothetical protein
VRFEQKVSFTGRKEFWVYFFCFKGEFIIRFCGESEIVLYHVISFCYISFFLCFFFVAIVGRAFGDGLVIRIVGKTKLDIEDDTLG